MKRRVVKVPLLLPLRYLQFHLYCIASVTCSVTVCQVGDGCGYVRTIVPSTPGGADGLLYIATTKNDILHGSLQDKLTTIIHVRIIA